MAKIGIKELEFQARAGRFTLVNVQSGGKGAHAVGIEAFSAEEGFLIHDPLLGITYYQKPQELLRRMHGDAVVNIVKE